MQNFSEIQALMKSDLEMTDDILINRLNSNVELINQMSHYIINSGGKRIRPLLLLLCSRATSYSGKDHHAMAVVIELIHTATLLHDDVVDESTTRRGQNTANELWGNAPSVLVGDFLYSRAFEIMVEPNSMEIMRVLSKATNQISEGEVLQLLNIRNAKVSGFLPVEREWIGNFIDSGFIDSFRHFNKEPDNYSWWSYRANARNNNKGWRIDYNMVAKPLQEKLKRAVILPEAKHSDHCPILVEIED